MRTTMMMLALAGLVTGCDDDTTSTTTASTDMAVSTTGSVDMSALGPGASLKCESSGKNAWLTYGSAGFVAVNKKIVALATSDTSGMLGSSFGKIGDPSLPATKDGAATFEGKLAAFLVYAYGGPESIKYTDGVTYTGPQDMVAAHTGLAITSDQYTYFLTNVVIPALLSAGVPAGEGDGPNDVKSCFAPVVADPAFIASIVGH